MTADSHNYERQKRFANKKKTSGYTLFQAWVKKDRLEIAREAIKQINEFSPIQREPGERQP